MTQTARDLVSKKAEGEDRCTGLSSGIYVSDMAHRCPHSTQEQKSTECTNDGKGREENLKRQEEKNSNNKNPKPQNLAILNRVLGHKT